MITDLIGCVQLDKGHISTALILPMWYVYHTRALRYASRDRRTRYAGAATQMMDNMDLPRRGARRLASAPMLCSGRR